MPKRMQTSRRRLPSAVMSSSERRALRRNECESCAGSCGLRDSPRRHAPTVTTMVRRTNDRQAPCGRSPRRRAPALTGIACCLGLARPRRSVVFEAQRGWSEPIADAVDTRARPTANRSPRRCGRNRTVGADGGDVSDRHRRHGGTRACKDARVQGHAPNGRGAEQHA